GPAALEPDVRDAGRQRAAAASILHQRRTRHPGALHTLHRTPISQIPGTCRHAAEARFSAHRPLVGARQSTGTAARQASQPARAANQTGERVGLRLWSVERHGVSYAAPGPVYFSVKAIPVIATVERR